MNGWNDIVSEIKLKVGDRIRFRLDSHPGEFWICYDGQDLAVTSFLQDEDGNDFTDQVIPRISI